MPPPQLQSPEFVAGREIQTFPTPLIQDKILTEYVNSEINGYAPLEYGTPFDSVQHTAFRTSYPNHVLVFQAPADVNGYFIRRVWASNRVDQELYDYSISYAEGDPDYPVIVRTMVLPRSGYVPVAPLSTDPVNDLCLLVSQELINEVQPQELSSLYVKVVRVYERVPGPVVTTYDYDTELNVNVITTRQVVLSTDVPTEDVLTVELKEAPRENSKYTKLRIISKLTELPAGKVEFETGNYQFPALVFGITCQTAQLTTDPQRSEVFWTPNMRNYPNVPALLRVTTTFHTSEPIQETLFEIPTRNLIYRGISFQIAINNVLNDAITVGATFTGDQRYGNLSESQSFAATTLTASAYNALIDTYKIIGCQIDRWRGQIWVKKKTEVLLV